MARSSIGRVSSGRGQKSLGSVFKAARTKAGFSVEQVESQTKIHTKYLRALEEGDFEGLPAEAYNIGFVRRLAQFLKLDPSKIVALYREERSRSRLGESDDIRLTVQRLGDWQFLITPKFFALVGALIMFGSVGAYIAWQLRDFTSPPRLAITNLPSQSTSSRDAIKLVGNASGGAQVTINEEEVLVTGDGSFDAIVQLTPGLNEIVVVARNRVEKESRQIVQVLYNPDLAKAPTNGQSE